MLGLRRNSCSGFGGNKAQHASMFGVNGIMGINDGFCLGFENSLGYDDVIMGTRALGFSFQYWHSGTHPVLGWGVQELGGRGIIWWHAIGLFAIFEHTKRCVHLCILVAGIFASWLRASVVVDEFCYNFDCILVACIFCD